MGRSKWKGPYIAEKSSEEFEKLKNNYKKTAISRTSEILPTFLEKTFEVYNGKKYVEILVTEEMIGHKFGEFSATRKKFSFKKKKSKK
jgi:ribosomal protein S19